MTSTTLLSSTTPILPHKNIPYPVTSSFLQNKRFSLQAAKKFSLKSKLIFQQLEKKPVPMGRTTGGQQDLSVRREERVGRVGHRHCPAVLCSVTRRYWIKPECFRDFFQALLTTDIWMPALRKTVFPAQFSHVLKWTLITKGMFCAFPQVYGMPMLPSFTASSGLKAVPKIQFRKV